MESHNYYYIFVLCLIDILLGIDSKNIFSIVFTSVYLIVSFYLFRNERNNNHIYKKLDNENESKEIDKNSKTFSEKATNFLFLSGLVLLHLLLAIGILNIILSPGLTTFPTNCSHPYGCTRVYNDDSSHRVGKDIKVVSFENSNLSSIIEKWQQSHKQTKVTFTNSDFYHFTFTTWVLGFIDDMEVKLVKCKTNPNMTSVYSHSELRIGSYDIEVNNNRIKDFYDYLKQNIPINNEEKCK